MRTQVTWPLPDAPRVCLCEILMMTCHNHRTIIYLFQVGVAHPSIQQDNEPENEFNKEKLRWSSY
jgi:hypothetical protein